MKKHPLAAVVVSVLFAPSLVTAQTLEEVQQEYTYGKFAPALAHSERLLDGAGLSEQTRVELHQVAGLSALNLDQPRAAERHFSALLRLRPDHQLDPFSVAPPSLQYFEKLKREMEPQLTVIRADRATRQRDEELMAAQEEKARKQRTELEPGSAPEPSYTDGYV